MAKTIDQFNVVKFNQYIPRKITHFIYEYIHYGYIHINYFNPRKLIHFHVF